MQMRPAKVGRSELHTTSTYPAIGSRNRCLGGMDIADAKEIRLNPPRPPHWGGVSARDSLCLEQDVEREASACFAAAAQEA